MALRGKYTVGCRQNCAWPIMFCQLEHWNDCIWSQLPKKHNFLKKKIWYFVFSVVLRPYTMISVTPIDNTSLVCDSVLHNFAWNLFYNKVLHTFAWNPLYLHSLLYFLTIFSSCLILGTVLLTKVWDCLLQATIIFLVFLKFIEARLGWCLQA